MTSISVPTPGRRDWATSTPPAGRRGVVPVVLFFFVLWTNLAVVLTQVLALPSSSARRLSSCSSSRSCDLLIIDRHGASRHARSSAGPDLLRHALPRRHQVAGTVGRPEEDQLYLTEEREREGGREGGRSLLLYLLVSNAVRTIPVLTATLWTLILAGALLGGLSVIQELTHTYANEYAGFAQVDRLGTGGGFNIAPADATQKELRPRLGGPLGSENRYAQILAVVFPLALMRAFRDPRRNRRLAGGAASILIAGGIFLLFSRGAAVAVGLRSCSLCCFELKFRHVRGSRRADRGRRPRRPRLRDSPERAWGLDGAFLDTTDSADRPDSALVGRETENLAALHVFIDHPFAGVGPGSTFATTRATSEPPRIEVPRERTTRAQPLPGDGRGHRHHRPHGLFRNGERLARSPVSASALLAQQEPGASNHCQFAPLRPRWIPRDRAVPPTLVPRFLWAIFALGSAAIWVSVVTRKTTPGHRTRRRRQASGVSSDGPRRRVARRLQARESSRRSRSSGRPRPAVNTGRSFRRPG